MTEQYPILPFEEALSILSQLEAIYDEKVLQLDRIRGNGARGPRACAYFTTLSGVYQRIRIVVENIDRIEIEIVEETQTPIPVESVTSFQIAEIAKRFSIPCSLVEPRRTLEVPKLTLDEANSLLEKAEALLYAKETELHNAIQANRPAEQRFGMVGREGFVRQNSKICVWRALGVVHGKIKALEEEIRVEKLKTNDSTISQEIISLVTSLGIEA